MRAALRHAWKAGRLPEQPYVCIPPAPRGRQRWLTRDEAKLLLKHADPRIDLYIRIALATGARRGAIVDLTWDRVDLDREVMDFNAPHEKAARRKHRAIVPIADSLLVALMRAKRRAGKEPRLVPLRAAAVQRLVIAAAEAADLPGVTPHVLRHTAATWMLGEGKIPLLMASAMLGHRSTAVTEGIYTHLTASHLKPAAELLGSMMG